ncbi:hypothetical protein V8E36_003443, partial [Tilletia maclaganii]
MSEDILRRLLDARPEKKDDDSPGFALPSFKVGESSSSGIHRLWHDCSALIPDDLIQLFTAGVHVPLSLFTLAAIRDFGIHQRRSTFTEKMSAKMQEELNSWHQRDNYLPFAEWAQAAFTIICLFRSIRVAPADEPLVEDPVHQLTEHAINIVARANSNNWPILREYDRRIRAMVWSQAKKGAALPFNISTLNPELIDNAENYIGGKSGAIADAAAALETGWAAVVQASAADVARVGQRLSQALNPSRLLRHPALQPASVSSAGHSQTSTPPTTAPALTLRDSASATTAPVSDSKASRRTCASGGTLASPSLRARPAATDTTALSAVKTVADPPTTESGRRERLRSLLLSYLPHRRERPRPQTVSDALSVISTSLHANAFQLAIDHLSPDIQGFYSFIPDSIRHGFSLGNFALPSQTHIWPNQYKPERQGTIDKWVQSSLDAGFIAGPFPLDEVIAQAVPVINAPLLIVDKHDEHGKLIKERVVYNASHPRHIHGQPPPAIPSLNSQIDKSDYPCEWLLVHEVKTLVGTAPPHARFCGWD